MPERWTTTFGLRDKKRFVEEQTPDYTARLERKHFDLTVHRSNVFVWCEDPVYRYRDFVAEVEFSFADSATYCSAGLLFRRANEENYYYFLVSNRGYYRFDVVFNGNPIALIDWTQVLAPAESVLRLRIIAHGAGFSFFVNDYWVGEMEDEHIDAGYFALGAQNYGESETAQIVFHRFMVESRPVEVERQYYRWNDVVPIVPAHRVNLARTLYEQREFAQAAVQLKKALKEKQATGDEYFLLTECFVNLALYQPALSSVEKCLEADPQRSEALVEKANLLYLLNRFVELRNYLSGLVERLSDNPLVWNLYGNAEYSLGNFAAATAHYRRAVELDPEVSLFRTNVARSMEREGRSQEAISEYVEASRLMFRNEDYDELLALAHKVRRMDPENREVLALQGKILFHEGKTQEAKRLFTGLLDEGYEESAVHYLLGLIRTDEGARDEADGHFRRAVELEPDFPLYWLRLAENRYARGLDPAEPLQRARQLDPANPWVRNLAGVVAMEQGDLDRANELLHEAVEAAPTEADPVINYSEVLFRQGSEDEAFAVLDPFEEVAVVRNHRGNLLYRQGRREEAAAEYERAHRLDPQNTDIMENCAALAIDLDRYTRAEELLRVLLDRGGTVRGYLLMGHLARLMGEFARAEASYREGLERQPGYADLLYHLADLYLERRMYDRARETGQRLGEVEDSERGAALLLRIRNATEDQIRCASCDRDWWVPKNLGPQPAIRLYGEPPSDAPAGKCPSCGRVYCVGCASQHVRDSRFVCPECDEYLRLSDDSLKYLLELHVRDTE